MLVFLLRVCSKNETYFAFSLTIHFLVHFTHALTSKHDGICIPATTAPLLPRSVPWLLPWLPPWLPLQPYHTTTTIQHSNNATLITHTIIATPKTMQIVGCCVFKFLLANFYYSLFCPYLHKLMLSPHPTDTLRGHNCLPPNKKKQQREKQREIFYLQSPLTSIFHHLIFQLNCCSQTSRRSLCRNSAIPLPQEPTNAITHLQLNGEGKNGEYSSFFELFFHHSHFSLTVFYFFQLKCCLVVHASCPS